MSRRKRHITLIAGLLLLLLVTELGLKAIQPPVAAVRIVNEGGAAIENLQLTTGTARAVLATIPDRSSATLHVASRGKGPLTITFQQKDNPLDTIEIPSFDPAALQREGSILVLTIRPNEYERFQDEDVPSRLSQFALRAQGWLEKALESP